MSESSNGNRASFSSGSYYRPLIPLLTAFVAGIFFANFLANHPANRFLAAMAVSGIFSTAGILLCRVFRGKSAGWLPLFLFFCLGSYALTPWLWSSHHKNHVSEYLNDRIIWKISGTVKEPVIHQNFRTVCFLDHLYLSRQNTDAPPTAVRGKIRVIIYGTLKNLSAGNHLIFTSKIRPFRNFKNPGAFDYVKYMTFQGTWGNAYTGANKITAQPAEDNLRYRLIQIRGKISLHIDQFSHGDANAILTALITGNRQKISNALRNAFNRAGISHILAISGLHIGIVAFFSFFIFTALLSRFHFFLRHGRTRKGAAVLSLFPVLAYGILAGMSPSTQRAVLMVGVFLLTFLIEREHDLINTVAVAALIILMMHPPSLVSISFQLSFAAVLSIIFGMPRIPRLNKHPGAPLASFAKTGATFVMISALAIIGTAPLTMLYFNQISAAGILSNLIFVPLIGFVVVPCGLFSLALLPVWPEAAGWGVKICHVILTNAIEWVYRISSLPYAAFKTVTPSMIEVICFYMLFGTLLYLLFPDSNSVAAATPGKKKPQLRRGNIADTTPPLFVSKKTGPGTLYFWTPLTSNIWTPLALNRRMRLGAGRIRGLVILSITLVILAGDIFYWMEKRGWKKDVTVSIVDVGQGNAALIEMPGGQCALIDGGGYTDNSIFDIGERVLAPFLWRKKIKTIETVILTHYDSDHINGLVYILNHFNVQEVFANHDAATCLKNEKFIRAVTQKKIHYPAYPDFAKTIERSGVMFNFLYPPENFSDLAEKDKWRDSNNNSMVVQVQFGNHSILFPGDIMKEAEKELLDANPELGSTILVAPHHGSSTSSGDRFLERVDPQAVIVSCGAQNRFGFPSPEVVARYAKNGIRILRTDLNGQVSISADGHDLTLSPLIP